MVQRKVKWHLTVVLKTDKLQM